MHEVQASSGGSHIIAMVANDGASNYLLRYLAFHLFSKVLFNITDVLFYSLEVISVVDVNR